MKFKLFLIAFSFLTVSFCFAQDEKTTEIPTVEIKTLDGKTISTDIIKNDGAPMILSFWATWCKPCIKELNALAELYPDWQDETGVKIVAVSIDDTRSLARVKPFVNGSDWDFEIYSDANGDFKRAMNVNAVPHTFLFDANGVMVDQHTSYAPGDEFTLYEKVKKAQATE
ncbi:MAG: TlpA family protein disulfide reductase [Bacteroidia bacterium]|nr:TlpA family protein disulfide reductase [Bacteroidia bacterium]NNC86423.1 TlpA family protein disulfide reductase [Bacteroidia bacterium]NNM16591.1 TlpA family protein disulfide reductase [Bacteroidia bacterium]